MIIDWHKRRPLIKVNERCVFFRRACHAEDLQRARFSLDCIVCERPLSYDGTFSPIVCPHRILSPGGRGTSLDEVTLRVQFFAS